MVERDTYRPGVRLTDEEHEAVWRSGYAVAYAGECGVEGVEALELVEAVERGWEDGREGVEFAAGEGWRGEELQAYTVGWRLGRSWVPLSEWMALTPWDRMRRVRVRNRALAAPCGPLSR